MLLVKKKKGIFKNPEKFGIKINSPFWNVKGVAHNEYTELKYSLPTFRIQNRRGHDKLHLVM